MTKRTAIGPMLRLVLLIGAVLQPLGAVILKRRLSRGKEDPERVGEKQGHASLARPDGPLVWLHGVGVGEVMALRALIDALAAKRPDLSFLLTSSARSSAQVIGANLPARTQHQYLPLDFPGPVRRFVDHWRPDLVVWSDQDVWPRLAVTAARRGIPQAYVAARITDASAKARSRFGRAYGDLYRLMDLRDAQDGGTAAHLRDLMGDDSPVALTGTLKAAAAPLADVPDARAVVPEGRKIWVAASAHMADVNVALDAHALLDDPASLLIVAPRALTDAPAIRDGCTARGLSMAPRSGPVTPETQVLLADTFGELGAWYRLAPAALIGGTFDATEGHNPWEAVALGCAVLHGPRTGNFSLDYKMLDTAQAARPITDAQSLADALRNPDLPAMADRANTVRASAVGGLATLSSTLLDLLDQKRAV